MSSAPRVGELPASLVQIQPDRWTAPFWEAAAEHRLVCARCTSCGRHRMPPSAFCPACRSQALVWDELAGTGTVFTFTVVRHGVIAAVKPHVPYVIAVVDLDGAPGARLITNVIDTDPAGVEVGMPVRVVWQDCGEGVSVPRVVPTALAGEAPTS